MASGTDLKCGKGLYLRPFSTVKAELRFFSLSRNSDRLAGTFRWSIDPPIQPDWYLPPQKIPLAENRFLQAGKGAENTRKSPGSALQLGVITTVFIKVVND
jgi:hypothetical protein